MKFFEGDSLIVFVILAFIKRDVSETFQRLISKARKFYRHLLFLFFLSIITWIQLQTQTKIKKFENINGKV